MKKIEPSCLPSGKGTAMNVKKNGMPVGADGTFKIVESTDTIRPAKASGELSDAALEGVAGGIKAKWNHVTQQVDKHNTGVSR